MAKDPAILFYFQDFLTGTAFMTDEEVGQYIKILCFMADKDTLTREQVLSICKASVIPKNIRIKLSLDGNGFYYNERMREEREKRRKFTESRRINASKCKAYAQHMENENENINVINKGESVERGDHLTSNSKPTLEEVISHFTGLGYPKQDAEKFWSNYESTGWEDGQGRRIKNWQARVMIWMNNSKQFNNNGKDQKPISPAIQQKRTSEVKQNIAKANEQIKREGKFKSFKEYEGVAK